MTAPAMKALLGARSNTSYAVSYVNGANAATTNTINFTAPTAGNLILLQARMNVSNGTPPTVPSGYTEIGTVAGGGTNNGATSVVHCYKVSNGTETSATFGAMTAGSRSIRYTQLSKAGGSWNAQHNGAWLLSTNAPAQGPVTPAFADGFALGGLAWHSSFTVTRTVSTPFSVLQNDNFSGVSAQYDFNGLATDITYEVTWTDNLKNCAIAVATITAH